MSLILEALKKSEQQRRLGEAPTLGSPAIASRRRRGMLPILAALILIALGAGAWMMRKPAVPAADTTVAQSGPARGAASIVPAPGAEPPASRSPRSRSSAPATPATPPAATIAINPPATSKPVTPPGEATRTPLRANLPPGDRPGSVAKLPPALPAVAGPARATPASPNSKEAASAAPAVAAAKAPELDAKAGTKPAIADARAVTKPAIADTATARAPAATRPVQPILPSVWELSYNIRKDLPEMSVTMHVYADDPAERFVVIKGARHVEGDTIADGVTLKAIRPDGMELEFKGTRFTYPRDGR